MICHLTFFFVSFKYLTNVIFYFAYSFDLAYIWEVVRKVENIGICLNNNYLWVPKYLYSQVMGPSSLLAKFTHGGKFS